MKSFTLLLFVGALASLPPKKQPAGDPAKGYQPVKLTPQALQIHREAILIDGHNDLPEALRRRVDLRISEVDLRRPIPDLMTDIPRLRAGGVGGHRDEFAVVEGVDEPDVGVVAGLEVVAVLLDEPVGLRRVVECGADGLGAAALALGQRLGVRQPRESGGQLAEGELLGRNSAAVRAPGQRAEVHVAG